MKCILCIHIRGFVEHSSCGSGTPKAAQKGKFFKDICDLKLQVCKVVLFLNFWWIGCVLCSSSCILSIDEH